MLKKKQSNTNMSKGFTNNQCTDLQKHTSPLLSVFKCKTKAVFTHTNTHRDTFNFKWEGSNRLVFFTFSLKSKLLRWALTQLHSKSVMEASRRSLCIKSLYKNQESNRAFYKHLVLAELERLEGKGHVWSGSPAEIKARGKKWNRLRSESGESRRWKMSLCSKI